ncbi:hypothetical protein [Kitasatospora sp. NPDC002040]|uniref:hypothetical protein n=1 Tax=Kitasatospora sp. NPDC002040 TaxID=3154661 RepID=UPI003332E702
MDDLVIPAAGMTLSLRTRQDVVIVDPERFLAAARAAFRELYPEATEEELAENVRDVRDAAFVLVERHGGLTADEPGPPGLLPGRRFQDRPDGLSPAGRMQHLTLGEAELLQDYGCFLPEDPFALTVKRV